MTQPTPRVSVIITVFNRKELLRPTFDSVLAQTMRDFELILVDDGSTDGSNALCHEYARLDPRIRVIEQPNGGIARAINKGLEFARAPLIARLDSDDLMKPTRLERQAAFMDAHPDVVCAGSFIELIDGKGRRLTDERKPTDNETIQDHLLRGHCAVTNPACMIRRRALDEVGCYDESFAPAEDFEMFLRLGEVGELANLPEVLTAYRLHIGSASAQRGKVQRENCRRACEQAWARRGESRPFEGSELWRPGEDTASQLTYTLRYGWWAWRSRQWSTAAAYGWDAVKLRPWCKEAWSLLASGLLHRQPGASQSQEGQPA